MRDATLPKLTVILNSCASSAIVRLASTLHGHLGVSGPSSPRQKGSSHAQSTSTYGPQHLGLCVVSFVRYPVYYSDMTLHLTGSAQTLLQADVQHRSFLS